MSLPRPPRLVLRELGPVTIVTLLIANAALWVALTPSGESAKGYIGQFLGAESILLLSIALVLISSLPLVEAYFDGMDHAAVWHRRCAIAGLLLVFPHIATAENPDGGTAIGGPLGVIGLIGMIVLAVWAILPRWPSVVPRPLRPLIVSALTLPGVRTVVGWFGGYSRWRALHRTTGIFVAAGFLHGLLDGSPWQEAPALRWTYVAIGGIGIAFYVWRELLAHRFTSLHDYQVAAVERLPGDITEIALTPIGRPMRFTPGQFAMVYLEAKDG